MLDLVLSLNLKIQFSTFVLENTKINYIIDITRINFYSVHGDNIVVLLGIDRCLDCKFILI